MKGTRYVMIIAVCVLLVLPMFVSAESDEKASFVSRIKAWFGGSSSELKASTCPFAEHLCYGEDENVICTGTFDDCQEEYGKCRCGSAVPQIAAVTVRDEANTGQHDDKDEYTDYAKRQVSDTMEDAVETHEIARRVCNPCSVVVCSMPYMSNAIAAESQFICPSSLEKCTDLHGSSCKQLGCKSGTCKAEVHICVDEGVKVKCEGTLEKCRAEYVEGCSCGTGYMCEHRGRKYMLDDAFDEGDGCNTCSCNANGRVICSMRPCQQDTCGNGVCEEGEETWCPSNDCEIADNVKDCPMIAAPCRLGTCPSDCAPTTAKCQDTDGGANYYVRGQVTGLEAPGVVDTWWDYCGVAGDEEGKLVEYVCSNTGYGKKILYNCPGECSEGMCVKPGTCNYGGQIYEAGESFKDSDGCNTCSCSESGMVMCTMMACQEDIKA